MSAPVPVAAHGLADMADTSEPADTLTLSHDARHLRREVVTCDNGLSVLIDLPHATVLEQGDRLALEDGRIVEVHAAPEALLEITGRDAHHLTRLAWHLGNRHLACQIESGRLLIRRDHVIADMLERLGAEVQYVEVPFTPEGGAYGHGHPHGHAH
jgi:urease accessory protein